MIEQIYNKLKDAGFNVEYDGGCCMATVFCDGYHVELQQEDGTLIIATFVDGRLINCSTIIMEDWNMHEGGYPCQLRVTYDKAYLTVHDRSHVGFGSHINTTLIK